MSEYGDDRNRGGYSREGADRNTGNHNENNRNNERSDRNGGNDNSDNRGGGGYSGGYNKKPNNDYGKSGGYNGKSSGGNNKKPYTPPEFKGMYKSYAVHWDKDTPQDVKRRIVEICRELADNGWTMRASATMPEILDISVPQEVILPFSSYDYEGKAERWYPSANCKKLAMLLTYGWDNIPEKAQSFVVHNWSLMVGRHLNSTVEMLITWTPDGITDGRECGRDTGYAQSFLDIATKYNKPIFNFQNDGEDRRVLEYADRYINKIDKEI